MAVKARTTITVTVERDIQAVYWFYLLQSSTASAPSKPAISPSTLVENSNWMMSEPAYTEGSTNSLYTVEGTLFTDGTWAYSEVSLSSSYEAAKLAYNKAINAGQTAQSAKDTADQALSRSSEFISGTQTAATGAWTGVSETITELYDGLQITYWLPYNGSGNATLNLTLKDGATTGAKNVYYKAATRVTTQFSAGSIIRLTYRENVTYSGGTTKYTGWWVDGSYEGSNTYDRTRYSNSVKVLEALTKSTYYIMVGTSAGYKKAVAGAEFNITCPVLAWYYTTAVSANATTSYMYSALPSVTLRNNVASWAGTQYSTVYLVGTLSGTTFTIDDEVFTTTLPTTEDKRVYMPIGVLYSTYQIYFRSDQTLYVYGPNGFAPLSVNAQGDAEKIADDLSLNYYTKTDMDSSLSVADGKIMGKVEATYVSNNSLKDAKDALNKAIDDAEDGLSEKLDTTKNDLADTNDKFAKFKKTVEGMLTFDLDANGVPTLAIQAIVDGITAAYAMKIHNSGYSVEYEGAKVGYMEKHNFAIPFAKVKEVHFADQGSDGSLGTASTVWVRRSNGHLTLKNLGG